jgi:hypothetical protein
MGARLLLLAFQPGPLPRERSTMRAAKQNPEFPLRERLKGIPAVFGIRLSEEPCYEVLASDFHREVRRYEPLTLASVTVNEPFDRARDQAFSRLAEYVLHANHGESAVEAEPLSYPQDDHEAMTMTTPVFQQKSRRGWTLSFVLPRKYELENAPRPLDPGITIERMPGRLVACLRYGGLNDPERMEEHTRELKAWLETNHAFRPAGEPLCAQYDGPHTIPFLRRNEIHIPVQVRH